MTHNNNLMTSPIGELVFMATERPITDSKTNKQQYTVKLAFDVKKDKNFLAQIAEINDAKVVTAQTYRGKSDKLKAILASGKALIEAKSNFKPTVYDSAGNELEESPMFFADSTGTAQMIVQPYRGDKGGTINLIGVVIHNVNSPEGTGGGNGSSRETQKANLERIRDQLRASAAE